MSISAACDYLLDKKDGDVYFLLLLLLIFFIVCN